MKREKGRMRKDVDKGIRKIHDVSKFVIDVLAGKNLCDFFFTKQ